MSQVDPNMDVPIDYSDAWTDEDLADFTAASVCRIEEEAADENEYD